LVFFFKEKKNENVNAAIDRYRANHFIAKTG